MPQNRPNPLTETLDAGRFAFTAEVTPTASAGRDSLLKRALPLQGVVDAVNVTDGASARVAQSNLAAAAILVAEGIEPVLQMTCRDRNRIALQGDLLGAGALGVRNILLLTGDDPSAGDQPEAKPVFDFDVRSLMRAAAEMRDHALLPSGRQVEEPASFFIGGADMPMAPEAGWTPDGLEAKIAAGAQFVQTQLCFDIELIRAYIGAVRDHGLTKKLAVLIGLGPLASARSAIWMRDNLFGVVIPDALIARMEQASDAKREGIAICAELLQQISEIDGIAGAHLMAPANSAAIPDAVAASGLRG